MKEMIQFNIDPVLYMHPADRAMLTKLEKMDMVAKLLGGVLDFFCRQREIEIMGSGIHVTKESLPGLYRNYQEVYEFFGVKNPPLLYLSGDSEVNAFAMGADRAFIVVHESLLWRLNNKEQKFMLGHELAHIMAGHMKYKSLLQMMLSKLDSIPFGELFKGIADISILPLLMLWSRRSEYTCDRAGMLAAQDRDTVYSFFLKLSGLPRNNYENVRPEIIMRQAEEFQQLMSTSMMDTFWAATKQVLATHPRPIERAAEVKEWIDEGWYEEIICGSDASRKAMADVLRDDPASAELRMLIVRVIIAWAMKEFRLSREAVAGPIRKALYFDQTLKGTVVERILRVEMSINPKKGDKIEYVLRIFFNKDGTGYENEMVLPLPESMDYTLRKVREEFIRNGNKPIKLCLYEL